MSKLKLKLNQKEQQLIITALECILAAVTIAMILAILSSRGMLKIRL